MRNYKNVSLHHLQSTQPWTIPYSSNFTFAALPGDDGMPYLYGAHAVLHATKTIGQLAAVFENLDHTGEQPSVDQMGVLRGRAADLVTAAMRIANLYHFDLAQAVIERSEEKNNVVLPFWPGQ